MTSARIRWGSAGRFVKASFVPYYDGLTLRGAAGGRAACGAFDWSGCLSGQGEIVGNLELYVAADVS